jgi:phage tail sheath protein FI
VISAPPDGATAGQLAASAWQRGAWLAVANRPLKDVLGVSLAASIAERQALLEAQVNPVVTAAHGVVLAGEDTLYHLDADWRPVHVRRLMSLLRRAALRRGNQYVFEPNGPTLHRTIERAFESLLGELMQRGAFAGRSAREAFQVVVVDDGLNSPASIDAGRLFIELKVAPAQALRFLTVRLVRAGDRVRAQENMA